MKILHTSDWHVTEGKRFDEALAVLRAIAQHGIDAGVDAWTVPGDFFGTTVPYRSSPAERRAVADILGTMAEYGPVFAVYGNHCAPLDLDLLGRLRARWPIVVASRPTVVTIDTIRAYLLPYPSKRFFMANGSVEVDISGQKVAIEGGLRAILDSWRIDAQEARASGLFTIGAMHVHVAGSATAGGEQLLGQEVELSRHDLDEIGLSYVALGHLHLQQQVADRAWYCGSPYGQNFGEHDPKAFLIVDLEHEAEPVVTSVPTPARRLLTVRIQWLQGPDGTWAWTEADVPADADVQDAEVRIIVEVPEDGVESCPTDELIAAHREGGAHSVKLERRILPKTRVRCEAIATAVTLEDQLSAYWSTLGTAAPDEAQRARCLAKLADLHAAPAAEGDLAA